jgi:HEPN domain-containing protein
MERYESWIERAKSCLEISKIAVNANVYYEDLCYQSQQAVEKMLKGLLIYYEVEPEFTHNIGILLNEKVGYFVDRLCILLLAEGLLFYFSSK